MNRMPCAGAPRQHQIGWGLLEAVVVVALAGLMATGFWKSLELVGSNNRQIKARETLQRVEDALYGLAVRDHRLPMPVDAAESAHAPDHWEGWLPADVLVTEPPRSIRYLVSKSLTLPPAVAYRADPWGMLGNAVADRTDANGLDLCLRVIQQEQAGLDGGVTPRLAFRLQQDGMSERGASGTGPSQAQDVRAVGILNLIHRLGCIPAIARLATEVKAATLASDLQEIAELNVRLHSLAVQSAVESLVNHQWRLVNVAARLAASSWNLVATKLTGATTPLGALKVATNIAGFSFEAARLALVMDYSIEMAGRARAKVGQEAHLRDQARSVAADRDEERLWRLQQVQALQLKGLMP
ncbi:MAG: hypothetical protein AB7S86_17490 [Hydrogenophaga sp.]|uniref:hypothetical protein n=1 Tax=Hydrogenophaga sp. TaxID=1904254 RepID=UPI003D110C07